MSRFSGRQTDSHGWTKTKDPTTGRTIGVPPLLGTPKQRNNKGVMRAHRAHKQLEAIERAHQAKLNRQHAESPP